MEKFKSTQNWEDALHAKFDYMTGDPVTNDDSWGHLQVRRGGEVVYLGSPSGEEGRGGGISGVTFR